MPGKDDNDGALEEIRRALHRLETHLGIVSQSIRVQGDANSSAPPTTVTPAGPVSPDELPMWLNAREIEKRIGLKVARLQQFAETGYVCKAKLGTKQQAATLYKVSDVLELLQRIAAGYLPRKKRKGV